MPFWRTIDLKLFFQALNSMYFLPSSCICIKFKFLWKHWRKNCFKKHKPFIIVKLGEGSEEGKQAKRAQSLKRARSHHYIIDTAYSYKSYRKLQANLNLHIIFQELPLGVTTAEHLPPPHCIHTILFCQTNQPSLFIFMSDSSIFNILCPLYPLSVFFSLLSFVSLTLSYPLLPLAVRLVFLSVSLFPNHTSW